MVLIMLCILIISSIYDIVNKHIIPLMIPAIGITIRIIELTVYEPLKMPEMCMMGVLIFIILLFISYFGNLGGADCLIGGMCGLYIGEPALLGMVFAFALSIPYTLQMKINDNEKEYAFIPYIFIGMAISLIISMKKGIIIW